MPSYASERERSTAPVLPFRAGFSSPAVAPAVILFDFVMRAEPERNARTNHFVS